MKKVSSEVLITLFAVVILVLTNACNTTSNTNEQDKETTLTDTIFLFNGKDLSGFEIYIEDTTYNKEDVWSVRDNLLFTTGIPFGYIRTIESYKNYDLVVEWRWVEEPKNSGVFLHIQNPDVIWPASIEAQLMHENAGDLIAVGETTFSELSDSTNVLPKAEASSEKPAGEWNKYEISCSEGNITLMVNGVLQNKASETSVTEGKIGLQSEGGPMEFKSFYLIPKK